MGDGLTKSATGFIRQPRQPSVDVFNPKSVPNEILTGLKYFANPIIPGKSVGATKENMKAKEAFSWGTLDSVGLGRAIVALCNQVVMIFKKEPRLLEVSSPAYVFGDIHGNYRDLHCFEQMFWNIGFTLSPANFLFLGDFVDRGPNGIEVISYLFAQKAKNPNRLHMVRGNHEVRDVQRMFTFYTECQNKFGGEFGTEVWNSINNVFDHMAVAAVVDGKIFCCHGGIPPPWLCPTISVINKIPCPLTRVEEESPLAWDILWNDPVRLEYMNEALKNELNSSDGFAVNKRRGTAHMFSLTALQRFLNVNKLTHVIRAHELQKVGFLIQMNCKLLTIFSNTHYNGGSNEAAVILLQDGRLRIMKVDTSEFWGGK